MVDTAVARQQRQADDEAGPRALAASVPVVEVTLLEDRGLVARRARLRLPPGRSRLRIEGVAPVLVDKTLAAALGDPDGKQLPEGLRVRDVRIERWRVTREQDRPADVAQLQARLRDLKAKGAGLQHELSTLEAEVASLAELEAATLRELAEDVGWARQDRSRWEAQLDQLATRRRELTSSVCERSLALHKVARDTSDLKRLIAASEDLDSHAAAALVVELVNPDSQEIAVELRVDYMVPGAMWRPWHTAILYDEGDAARVELRTDGCVWQATGEDWTDVELVFSTERPSLGVAPPQLQTDFLRARKRGSAVEVQTREQEVHTAGLGGEAPRAAPVSDDLPGIDDGGEALELRARVRASVPADGRPHRIPILAFETAAEAALVCVPELEPAVLLRTRQANRSSRPLLAGPVDLIRRGGIVGRTSLLFVASGERFDLGWGPDSALRVTREVEYAPPERRALSSWTRKPRHVCVRLSNLDPQPRTIELQERIAVSEVEKVEVELGETSPMATVDDDGFVTWTVRLRGFARQKVSLAWTLVVHDDVAGL